MANLGDSMAIYFKKNGLENPEINQICKMHSLNDQEEQRRIVNAGFVILKN